nr:hypothetical protein [Tanacetum cinerariifolium]
VMDVPTIPVSAEENLDDPINIRVDIIHQEPVAVVAFPAAAVVMDAPTIPVSTEENLEDPINIRVDIIHQEPVAAVAFLAAAVVRTQAQHGEAI